MERLLARVFELLGSERPGGQRILARESIRGTGKPQRSIVLAARCRDKRQTDQAPDDSEPVVDDTEDRQRLVPRCGGLIDIAEVKLCVGETFEISSQEGRIVL